MEDDLYKKLKEISTILFYRLEKKYGKILLDKDDFFSQILTTFLEEEEKAVDLYSFVYKKGRSIFLKELRTIKKNVHANIEGMMRITRSIESKVDVRRKVSQVFKYFKFLTHFQKKLFYYFFIEEYNTKELCKKFNLSAPTLRKELKKLFDALKKS